jgi:response regulator of citrate/malate metabolism
VIRVLVVDDEPIAAEAHADYLTRLDGFELAGIAHSARQAQAQIARAQARSEPVDLILLDITLPDASGLELARALCAARMPIDFIAITAIRQMDTVQAALGVGVVQYLIKPFGFALFREKLGGYLRYRALLAGDHGHSTQQEVDAVFSSLRPSGRPGLPKGLTSSTLESVTGLLRRTPSPLSASEAAELLGLSRVTARRYLEHLCDDGLAVREQASLCGSKDMERPEDQRFFTGPRSVARSRCVSQGRWSIC